MDPNARMTFTGQVTDVFAHRFVVETAAGKILADLGPKGAERLTLRAGDQVEVSGEMKPSELKVHRIVRSGEEPVAVAHKTAETDGRDSPKPHPHGHPEADIAPALRTVEANGFAVLGAPRRRPKHFEILGRDKAGDLVELHVELNGTLRKSKPVEADDAKWKAEIAR